MPKVNSSFSKNKFLPLLVAFFILSIFAGVILNIVVRLWVLSNINTIKQIQAKEESQRLDKLLNRFNSN